MPRENPIHVAVREQNYEDLQQHLYEDRYGELVNQPNEEGLTPLHLAVSMVDKQAAKQLISNQKTNLSATVEGNGLWAGYTALAILADNAERDFDDEAATNIADNLIFNGAERDALTPDRNSALHIAAERVLPHLTKALYENGVDPSLINSDGLTAENIVQAKIDSIKEVNANPRDEKSGVPLRGDPDKALKDAEQVLEELHGGPQGNALHVAVGTENYEEIGQLLAQDGTRELINKPNNQNLTPLHLAAANHDEKALDLLLSHKDIDPNIQVSQRSEHLSGATALTLLIANTDDISYQGDDVKSSKLAAKLLEGGADVQIGDADDNSPLHMAAKNLLPEVTKTLLKYGADPTAKNREGSSAGDISKEKIDSIKNVNANQRVRRFAVPLRGDPDKALKNAEQVRQELKEQYRPGAAEAVYQSLNKSDDVQSGNVPMIDKDISSRIAEFLSHDDLPKITNATKEGREAATKENSSHRDNILSKRKAQIEAKKQIT